MSKFNKKKKFESFRTKMRVEAINFQKDEFGIFRCSPIESGKEIKLNWKGEFNLKGNIPYDLKVEKVYTVYMGNPEYNEKYRNYTYEIDKFEVEQLTKPEEQFEFLQTVTTPNIYQEFVKHYDGTNIIDLIFNDQIDLNKIHGMQQASYDKLKDKLELYKDLGKLQLLLAPLGVTVKAITKIAKHFDSPDRAHAILSESLYNLCEVKGYGFKKVDEICLKANVPVRDPIRISECLKYIIDLNTGDGHSWSYRDDIMAEALEYLNIEPELINTILDNAPYQKDKYYKPNDIIVVGELVSLYRLYQDERSVLKHLDRINKAYEVPVLEDVDILIKQAENELGITYNEEQRATIVNSLKHGVYVVEGQAGSGKTTIIKGIVIINKYLGKNCVAATLSGKASQVLISKGLNASTIHRLLGYNGDGFAHNEEAPIPYYALNFDEAGMANANIWSSFTCAIADKAHFVISGDSGQLSAIGHGDILRDILASKRFAKSELKEVHRQALDSGVIEVAHKIRRGENITGYNREITENYGKNEDLTIIARSKPKKDDVILHDFMNDEEIKEAQNPIYQIAKQITQSQIAKIKQSENPEQGILDFQVIAPTKSAGALSVDSMNKLIQREYNDSKNSIKLGKGTFFEKDKVIVSGNTYRIPAYASITDYELGIVIMGEETVEQKYYDEHGNLEDEIEGGHVSYKEFDLFNGTIGIVKYVDTKREIILVKFEGINGLIALDDEACEGLDLGYAITIHKSQGSGFPNVMVLFDFGAYKMLTRELIYTAITRTSDRCVVVCENNALFKACSSTGSGNRRTFMSLFLEQLDNQQ